MRRSAGRIPEKNVCVVRYEDLLQNLEPTMERILDFIEIKPTDEFEEEVRQQAERATRLHQLPRALT